MFICPPPTDVSVSFSTPRTECTRYHTPNPSPTLGVVLEVLWYSHGSKPPRLWKRSQAARVRTRCLVCHPCVRRTVRRAGLRPTRPPTDTEGSTPPCSGLSPTSKTVCRRTRRLGRLRSEAVEDGRVGGLGTRPARSRLDDCSVSSVLLFTFPGIRVEERY